MKSQPSKTSADYAYPDPGELNQRARLRQRVDLPNDDFGVTAEFTGEKTVWAKVRQVGATTYRESVQTGDAVTHYLTIRYRPGVTADFEVVMPGGNVLRIRRIRDLNSARRFLLLECEDLGSNTPVEVIYG
ncbi:phage head closure protein [Lonsdalea quercina]|uniref:phage head closure protein n=1 Tax=Lonsdalea quercina TaxID=71657 RepID=UPI00397626B7